MAEYRQCGKDNMAKAFKELGDGDLAQASEKGWGAAALMVKAMAEQRVWDHNSHGGLHVSVNRLAQETGDDSLNRLFLVANGLHVNFYEGWFQAEQVEVGLEAVRQFVDRMDALLDARPMSHTPNTGTWRESRSQGGRL
jgi:hypothetical protein